MVLELIPIHLYKGKMTDVPRSKQFDDVYFSQQDGLEETRHVFIAGNGLPESWCEYSKGCFTICETGFGTGLNFLAVAKLWMETPSSERPEKLQFISFEKYPLDKEYISKHLSHWGELGGILEVLLSKYPNDLSDGRHEIEVIDGVWLTLIFGDVNDQMPELDGQVDCWFLDGFKPSSNPDMWSEEVFTNMARLSSVGARFATFTVAGFVRRGLAAQGFDVRKVPGFGRKREMCAGVYAGKIN